MLSLSMPLSAFPTSASPWKPNALGYTNKSASGARVEVQLPKSGRAGQFYIKAVAPGFEKPASPTVAWKKNGGIRAAWLEAKKLTGWA